jgi:UDP-N-acetylmuramate dehydrogenase
MKTDFKQELKLKNGHCITNDRVYCTENKSLKELTTFGFDAVARYYAAPESLPELRATLKQHADRTSVFVLGGGSNVFFADDYAGLVLRPQITGIEVVGEDAASVSLKVGAGVAWDDFVAYAVAQGLGGVENLSAIPGTAGAAPVQNIGAYGAEAKDAITTVSGLFIDSLEPFELGAAQCGFAYRDSIFKHQLRNKTVITSVVFRLAKQPVFRLDYANLRDEAAKYGELSLANIRRAVINIRADKLPDPKVLGNAGSFFKNPSVDDATVQALMQQYPAMPAYPSGETGKSKLSAGWLIEQCGLKGYREGNVGVHSRQALVLVNFGNGSAAELIRLAQRVQDTVKTKFGVAIEQETLTVYNS